MDARTKKARTARAAHLWYKDAIIYQLHVKSFFDSDNDGIGDFPGLISKLDYIADLGVNAIWVLPFYPSPLLDDGYDISGYRDVHVADSMPLPGQSADGLVKCMPFWRERRRIPRSPPKLLMTAMPPDGQRKRSNVFKKRSRPSLVCRRGSVNRIRNVHRSL